MKAVCLFALCLMAGVASSELFAWKVGKTYTYAVRGRVMTGISQINTQYSGLEMNYDVIMTIIGENKINLKPTHIKLVEVNDKIKGGWRDGELHGERAVELTEEFRMYLESPIEFTVEKGIVKSLTVEGNLPMWAINMKKAQVAHWVMDTTGVNSVLRGNLDRHTGNLDHHESGYFYETMEKTVHGECKTYYTVGQNLPFVPPFQFHREVQPSVNHNTEESHEIFEHETIEKIETEEEHHALPWHNTFHKFCHENDHVFEIIKSVNFTDCKQKPVLGHFSPTASKYVHASENGAGSFGHRALVSRFLACGKDRKEFTILRVRQEEQMKVGTHLVKKMIAGAVQNITLISITEAKTPVTLKNPKVVKHLIYTFHLEQGIKDTTMFTTTTNTATDSSEEMQMDAAYINYKSSEEIETPFTETEEHTVLPKPTLHDAPLNALLASPLKIVGMKHRIEELMREIVEDLTKHTGKESLAEKETLSKISTIAKILRYFSYNDVKEIFNRFADKKTTEEEKTRRNIIIDCISIAGTNPNIKLLLDMIRSRVIVGERAARILMTFPMYIRTPTVELLKEIFNFVKTCPMDNEKVQIKTTATLALSKLLHQACVNIRVRNSRYPVSVYGQFCDAKVVETEFLPYFVQQLEQVVESDNKENTHWMTLWMTALGNIGHPHIIPVVQKLMDKIVNPIHKVHVVYMLKNLIVLRPSIHMPELVDHKDQIDVLTREIIVKKVVPILVSAAFDKGEHPEVRMAAISLLFKCPCVDVTIWQQLAYMTWFEVSQEVHSFVFNTLKNLAELKTYTPEINYRQIKTARYVLTICKPITAGYTKSRNIFSTDFIQEHLSGYMTKLSYWGSKDSMIPNLVHYKNIFSFGNGAFEEIPLEMSFHGHTTQKLINFLIEQIYKPSTASREAHEDVAQIREILGIEERKQTEKVEGKFYLKIQNEMERMFSFDKQTLEKWIRLFKSETLPKLRNGYPIHVQKTFHLREHLFEVPTIFGFPATYNFRMPVHVSLKGLVKLVSEDNMKDIQIQGELHPQYVWKTHERLSFKVPFVQKKYQTGFQRHVVAEMPFRALVRLAPRGQVEVAVTPVHLKREQLGEVNLITFHQKPYTVIVTDSCWPVTHKEGGVMKIVHAVETPYKKELNFGHNMVGLKLKLESETHYRVEREGKSAWFNYLTKFHSLNSFFNLNWMGEPSLRFTKRKLSIDMSQSETKTIVLVWGRDRKMTVNTIVKDSSEEKQTSEEHTDKTSHLYTVALIGKKNPIESIYKSTGVQKVLEKGTTSTINYLFQWYMTRGVLKVQFGAGKAAKEVAMTLKETCPSLLAIREAIVECPLMEIQHDMCLVWDGKYERPIWANRKELIVLRKRLLAEDLIVKVQNEWKFGKTCNSHVIKMEGNLRRDAEMTEWARNKSPQALKCIEDERKGFTVSPVCLWVSEQQAAALNKIHLEFHWTELPTLFKNYMYRVEDWVKTWLFPYVTHDRFPVEGGAGEKKLVVDWRMTPNKEFFNLHLNKPTSRLNFDNVKMTEWRMMKNILPLTSTQNIFENVRDRTLRFYSEPSCTLEGKFVNTFDNVTYKFSQNVVSKCQHVLTQDCSGKYPMTVLVKDINTERKIVTVLLGGKTKIEIIPRGNNMINKATLITDDVQNNFIVMVNDRKVESFPEIIRLPQTHDFYHKYIAKIELMVNGGIQVISPRLRVATDAARVVVYGSNAYRNRTCGLCGNFDGEKVAELRSPKNCPLSSGSLMVASYAFPPLHHKGQEVCTIDAEVKKHIELEENDCKKNRVHVQIPKYSIDIENMDDITFSTKKIMNDEDCEVTEKMIKRVENLGLCKSERNILRCRTGCVPKSTHVKKVWFNCTEHKTLMTERVVRKTLMIDEPTECIRGY